MNLVGTLWQLQTLDQEIDEKNQRLRHVDDGLANDPVVGAARTVLATEQKKLDEVRAGLRDRELEAKGLDAKLKELNQRLYSGYVVNPKELDGLSKDLEMHKRLRSALDDKLLELMDSVDQAQIRVNALAENMKQVESKRAGDLGNINREREAIAMRLKRLSEDRDKTRGFLDAKDQRL